MKSADRKTWAASVLLTWAEKQIASGRLDFEEEVRGRRLVADIRIAYDAPLPCHRADDDSSFDAQLRIVDQALNANNAS